MTYINSTYYSTWSKTNLDCSYHDAKAFDEIATKIRNWQGLEIIYCVYIPHETYIPATEVLLSSIGQSTTEIIVVHTQWRYGKNIPHGMRDPLAKPVWSNNIAIGWNASKYSVSRDCTQWGWTTSTSRPNPTVEFYNTTSSILEKMMKDMLLDYKNKG